MKVRSLLAALMAAGLALALTALPAPASAQTGGVSGKIVDEAGKPIADVDVVLNNPEGSLAPVKLKTNAKGEYQAIGIRSGNYQIKATKGDLSILSPVIHVGMGGMMELPLLHLKKGGGGAVSEDEAKKQAAIAAAFKSAQAAADAGNFDDAVTQFTKLATDVPKCTLCYVQIGRALAKKGDNPGAEAAFKQAVDADPTKPDGYSELASFYNAQKKFDEANQASAKAAELMTASGSSDPVAIFNQGIILWNQSKAPEAQVQFEKAAQLDPKMADAQYFLGMTLVNQGKLPDAKKPFETYLSLAPTGQYADQVKGLLQVIK
jgi:tetratricopeptide (TPR) repeat protein